MTPRFSYVSYGARKSNRARRRSYRRRFSATLTFTSLALSSFRRIRVAMTRWLGFLSDSKFSSLHSVAFSCFCSFEQPETISLAIPPQIRFFNHARSRLARLFHRLLYTLASFFYSCFTLERCRCYLTPLFSPLLRATLATSRVSPAFLITA